MPYATQSQIQFAAGAESAGDERFLSLFDWNGDGAADADVIAEAQARADGWIDSFLQEHYNTPLVAPPDSIVRIAADECVYWARQARGLAAITPNDDEKHKERQHQLEQFRDLKQRMPDPQPLKSSAVRSTMVDIDGHITKHGLKGMW